MSTFAAKIDLRKEEMSSMDVALVCEGIILLAVIANLLWIRSKWGQKWLEDLEDE
jgi:hypothetical protein